MTGYVVGFLVGLFLGLYISHRSVRFWCEFANEMIELSNKKEQS